MKTALQELIERFEGYIEKYDRDPLIKKLVNSIKYECEKDLFEKEKEQIELAFNHGMRSSETYFDPTGKLTESENYLKDTYGNERE